MTAKWGWDPRHWIMVSQGWHSKATRQLLVCCQQQCGVARSAACQTATGSVRLPEEGISTRWVVQEVGCRHAIATRWTIADTFAPEVTCAVYARPTTIGRAGTSHTARRSTTPSANFTKQIPEIPPYGLHISISAHRVLPSRHRLRRALSAVT